MLRLILFFVILIIAGIYLARLADVPGSVTLEWMGWQIETSALFLLFALGTVILLVTAGYLALNALFSAPKRYLGHRRVEHHERGLSVLTEAVAAMAASDHANAKKLTHKADRLLGKPPITRLLKAQLARIEGDDKTATSELKALMDYKETRFIAARNLLEHARNAGDTEEALAYAEEAESLRPDSSYATLALLDFYSREGQWQKALHIINKAKKHKALTKGEVDRYTAIIHYLHANHLYQRESDDETSLAFAKKAHSQLPDFVPATLLLARLLARHGKKSQITRHMGRTWKLFPHPAIANLYRKLMADDAPSKRLKKVEKLVSSRPDSVESQIAVAEAALDAQAFGKARNHLKIALSKQETPRICKLMARLEELENKDKEKADAWIERAVKADLGPSWVCSNCHSIPDKWSLHCPECESFDSIHWKENKLKFVDTGAARLPVSE